jgi:hypothetical protein
MGRDSSLADTDSLQLVLDTYLDRQNGFTFGTNPAGLQYDAQVTNEGEGGGINTNWDAPWRVEAMIGDFGWSAELTIPFSTLRYQAKDAPVWGLNVRRNIRRRNERAYWSPVPRRRPSARRSASSPAASSAAAGSPSTPACAVVSARRSTPTSTTCAVTFLSPRAGSWPT